MENTVLNTVVKTAARNGSIWHANRNLGIGTGTLAKKYGLSRERIRQIIRREDQRRQPALSALAPDDRFPQLKSALFGPAAKGK